MGNFEGAIIVPSGVSDGGYIPLSRTKQGRLFRKHILNKGTLIHPSTKQELAIDDEFVSKLKENFDNKVCDIVQVPLAGPKNEHTEAPDRNIGEVIGIEESDGKIYALIDAREESAAQGLGKTLLGASAMMHLDYTDTRTGERAGPALLHVCVTNRPYVTGLEDYEELIAASADNVGEVVILSQEENKVMTKSELLEQLKETFGVDVSALEAQVTALTSQNEGLVAKVAEAAPAVELSNKLSSALVESKVVELSNGEELSNEKIVDSIVSLGEDNVELSSKVETLEEEKVELSSQLEGYVKSDAEHTVDSLVSEGRIIPANRDAMVELRLSNKEMFDKLVPENPVVSLSQEEGTNVTDEQGRQVEEDIDAEIARLTAYAK